MILCDTALVYGYSTNADKIDVGLVREVIKIEQNLAF
jgi:copper homeostasis protein CutC